MLAGGQDILYRNVLSGPHRRYIRIEVWSGSGAQLAVSERFEGAPEGGLVLGTGTLTATLNSRVSRTLTIGVPWDLYPVNETDLLTPFGNELRVFYGIRFADGSSPYVWPVFRGRIQEVTQNPFACTVSASDRAADVIDHGFVSPMNSQPINTINDEFERLILDAIPNANFGTSDSFGKFVEPLTWEFDRGSALDEMARSVGALWYPLAAGEFVIRRYPWTVAAAPVVTWSDQAGGTVLDWNARRSRGSIYNTVTVTGERLNGDTPVHATAADTVPGSPTNVNGNFGVRSALERLQNPATQGGAQSAADALLRTYVSPVEEWTLQVIPDGALELGDIGIVQVNGRSVIQVVTSMTLPLDLSGNMTVSTRSLVVGGV